MEKKAQAGLFTPGDSAEYDKLLLLNFHIKNNAKKKCRKFYSGQVLYSVIAKDRKEIHLWNMVISRRAGKRTDTRAIRCLMNFTGTGDALRLSLEQAESRKAQCLLLVYRQHKKAQVALREAEEESGLTDLIVESEVFDLERHAIPARGSDAEHFHHDVRFVVHATGSEEFVVSDESHALAWRVIEELVDDTEAEESIRRMARKWLKRFKS